MLIKNFYKFIILLLIFTTIFSFNNLIDHRVEAKEEVKEEIKDENKEMKNSVLDEEASLQKNEEPLNAFSNDKNKTESLVTKDGIVPEATGMLTAFPNVNVVDAKTGESTGKVPGEYANILMYSSKTEYKVVGATSKLSSYSTFDENATEASGGEHYIEATNVGVYQGKKIDVRINAQSMTGKGLLTVYTAKTAISSDFLRIRVQGRDNKIAIRYDFIDHDTGKKIPYKGTWIIKRLNDYKTLRIDTSPEHLKSIFGYSTSAIAYSSVAGESEKTDFVGTTGVITLTNLTTQMMYSFNAKNGSTVQEYLPDGIGNRNVYYDSVAIAQMEVPFPSLFGQKTEDYPKVRYEIQQDYPEQAKASFYPTSYNLAVLLDDIVDVNSLKMTVKDLEGNDVTNKFTLTKVAGTKVVNISVASSTLTSSDFVNNSYTVGVEADISSNANLDKYIQEDGYLHIPASISMQTNLNQSPVQTDDALVKSPIIYGTVHTKYVAEDEKTELAAEKVQSGVVGENYTVKQEEIEDYTFVRAVGNTEGKFAKESQTVLMVYKKNEGTVTTEYVEEGSEIEIADSEVQSGVIGENYTVNQKEIKEYKFVKAIGNTTGKFTKEPQRIVMVYTKKESTVTTKHVKEDEKTELGPENIQTGRIGESYEVLPNIYEGYEFVRAVGNTEGKFTEESQTVLMVYKEIIKENVAPKITLDQESTEPIDNTDEDFKLSGQVTDEDSDEISVFYKVDAGEEKKIETFKQPEDKTKPFAYSSIISKDVLNDGEQHTIEVYAVDNEGAYSEETPKVILKAYEEPTNSLNIDFASNFNFGEQEMVTTLKTYMAEAQEVIGENGVKEKRPNYVQVSDKRKKQTGWRLSVVQNGQFKGVESGDELKGASLYFINASLSTQETGEKPSTVANRIVLKPRESQIAIDAKSGEGAGTYEYTFGDKGNMANVVGFQLPGGGVKNAEQYTTDLTWSLEDAPENK